MGIDAKAVSKLGIRYVKSGPPELVRALNDIINGMDRLVPATTPDIISSVTAHGTLLRLRGAPARPSAGGVADGPFPFDVSFVDLVPGTSKTASVRPGSINSLIPSNYLTTYALLNSTQYFLVLSVTTSAGEVTGATLSMPTSAPSGMPVTMGAPPTSFEVLIGVVIDGAWYRTIGEGSLQATATESFKADKASPSPGTLPYDIYYTWELANV